MPRRSWYVPAHHEGPPPELVAAHDARRRAIRKLERGHGVSDDELRLIAPDLEVLPVPDDAPKCFARCQARVRTGGGWSQCVQQDPHPGMPHRDGLGSRW